MKPELILNADVLDILFDGRNKEYGAYALRKGYERRMYWALGGMLAAALSFVLLNFSFGNNNGNFISTQEFIIDTMKLSDLDIEKPKPPKPVEPPKKLDVATIQNTTPVLTDKVDVPPPTVEDLNKDVRIGTETKQGVPASEAPVVGDGDGKAPVPPAVEKAPEPEVYERTEIMPEYPGGMAALYRFLQRSLRFQFDDMEPGARIEIRCRFVVDEAGKVTGIQILKSGGRKEFDEEVTRVVGKMPQWEPGKQNGRNVKVYYTIPVIVEVPEQ